LRASWGWVGACPVSCDRHTNVARLFWSRELLGTSVMKRPTSVIIALLIFVATPIHSAVAGDAVAGKVKAQLCAACHGADGNSANSQFPSLAGQVPGYIAAQLTLFKSGNRANPVMAGMAAPLSQTDIQDLDAYFSAQQSIVGSISEADVKAAESGGTLYRGGFKALGVAPCMGCHGPAGRGIPPKYPRLTGQHPEYLERQLQAFKTKTRKHRVMSPIAFLLTPQQMREVSLYVSALK
jgi:cytochrome c553